MDNGLMSFLLFHESEIHTQKDTIKSASSKIYQIHALNLLNLRILTIQRYPAGHNHHSNGTEWSAIYDGAHHFKWMDTQKTSSSICLFDSVGHGNKGHILMNFLINNASAGVTFQSLIILIEFTNIKKHTEMFQTHYLTHVLRAQKLLFP